MGEARHVLTGAKLAEFHSFIMPAAPTTAMWILDPLQTKLQYPRLNEFDQTHQSLADLRPNSYETHVPGDTTVTMHIEFQNNMELKLYKVSRVHSLIFST